MANAKLRPDDKVINLEKHRSKQLVDLLESMLILARGGEIRALAFVAKFGQRSHRTGRLGEYRQNPAEAILAVQLLNQKLLAEIDVDDL